MHTVYRAVVLIRNKNFYPPHAPPPHTHLRVKPHYLPAGLEVKRGRIADDVVNTPADPEGVCHQRQRQPEVAVSNCAQEEPHV